MKMSDENPGQHNSEQPAAVTVMDSDTVEQHLNHSSMLPRNLGHDEMLDLRDEQSSTSAKDRPTAIVSNFEQALEQGEIELKDPQPGYLRFPGSLDANGQQLSIQETFEQRSREILPSSDAPMWKQILEYCKSWGPWVATVDDDKRRAELAEWIGKKMQGAWQFAVLHGHCGEPNGHQSCCLAHDTSGKSAKKPVDVGKLPASFASDGQKYNLAIRNSELQQQGISMDSIMARLTPADIESGNDLLSDMEKRLGRSLIQRDWTTVRLGVFNPKSHARNLLMFCLWEAVRCREIVQQTNRILAKSLTVFQQKNMQRRLEVHKQRTDQHLALAVILNEKRSEQTEEEDSDPGVEVEELVKRPRRTKRLQKLGTHDHPSDSRENDEAPSGRVAKQEDDVPSLTDRESSHRSFSIGSRSNRDYHFLESNMDSVEQEDSFCAADSGGPQLNDSLRVGCSRGDSQMSENKLHVSKRESTDSGVDIELLPFDMSYDVLETEAADVAADVSNMTYEAEADNHSTGSDTETSEVQQLSPLHRHPENTDYASTAGLAEGGQMTLEQCKAQYTQQYWQPWVNTILQQRGLRPLQWQLKDWDGIRRVLEQLDFDMNARNNLLRDYKVGFAKWYQYHAQALGLQQGAVGLDPSETSIKLRIPKSESSQADPQSQETLNQSQGFSFRYSSSATKREREQVDDMVREYIQYVLKNRYSRFGYYVVFMDPRDPRNKELAYGIWGLQKNERAPDADWLYQNQPKPGNFRSSELRITHQWGYSIPPPKRQPSKRTGNANNRRYNNIVSTPYTATDRKRTHSHPGSSHSRNQGGKAVSSTNSNTRKRKRIIIDSDSDDDYDPRE